MRIKGFSSRRRRHRNQHPTGGYDNPGAFAGLRHLLALQKSDIAAAEENPELLPVCFFWDRCHSRAACEKQGKAVCDACAARLPGTRYPLRSAKQLPPYTSVLEASRALDMPMTFTSAPFRL